MKRLLIAALALTATMSQAATYGWTVVDLGALGPTGSVPTSINNNGDVTGYSRSAASTDGTPYHGFLYRNGAMYDLGKPAGSAFAQVMAMNDAGTLAATDERGNGHLWKDGTWIPLNFHGKPKAVNRVDMVVGTFPLGAGERAFLWASGMATELGTLGGTKSRGNSVNDRGIVVGSATIAGDGTSHAFLYDNGDMKDLGTLGGTYSSANDINNFGVVVGGAYNAQNKMTAFVYDSSGMRALFNAGDTSSATAINDRGAVVGRHRIDTARDVRGVRGRHLRGLGIRRDEARRADALAIETEILRGRRHDGPAVHVSVQSDPRIGAHQNAGNEGGVRECARRRHTVLTPRICFPEAFP